ncbi:MAG: nucleotide-binding protein [Planctomycetes bacterium]|uniref:TIR domain-containing protein n=1 Tax=Candidatus Wunengus sp. YC65 TaxID=3367701 RepID=UPI001D201F3A|nr:nucleotide-binding protein [Planctomycetota bacterium]
MPILIVEDDNFYAQRLKEVLMDFGLEATLVNSTQEALSSNIPLYAAAIIDIMLPNDPDITGISLRESRAGYLSGVALARRFRQKVPNFPIILFSGYFGSFEGESWARDNGILFFSKEDGPGALKYCLQKIGIIREVKPRVFIVHGHDEHALIELKDYIQNTLNWQKPIVLRDEPSSGRTIVEKFEDFASSVDYVFVLMTPDDIVRNVKEDDKRRSRQNVIFELGFFYGQFGRKSGRVIVLHKGPIELPSDIQGIIWIDISKGIKESSGDIRRELKI